MWNELREHFNEQKIYVDEKRQVLRLRDKYDQQIQDLQKETQKLLRLCHPTYNTADDLDKGIRILNRRLETNTFTSQKENELIKEIN